MEMFLSSLSAKTLTESARKTAWIFGCTFSRPASKGREWKCLFTAVIMFGFSCGCEQRYFRGQSFGSVDFYKMNLKIFCDWSISVQNEVTSFYGIFEQDLFFLFYFWTVQTQLFFSSLLFLNYSSRCLFSAMISRMFWRGSPVQMLNFERVVCPLFLGVQLWYLAD